MKFKEYAVVCLVICGLLLGSCSHAPVSDGTAALKPVAENVNRVSHEILSKDAFVNFHYMMAYFYFSNGQLDKAVHEFKMVLGVTDDPSLFKEYINMLTYTGNMRAMISGFEEAIHRFPNAPYFYLRMAGVLTVEGMVGRALKVLKEAYAKFPKNAQVLEMLGFTYIRYNNYTMGMKFLNKALKYSKDKAKIYLFMGSVFKSLGFYDRAVESAKKALQIRHSYVDAILLIGTIYEAEGTYTRAIHFYSRWLDLKDPRIYAAIANDYYHLRKYDKSLSFLKKALLRSPNNPEYLEKICYIYFEQGKLKKLVQFAGKYSYTAAYSDKVRYIVGMAYGEMNNCRESLSVLRGISPVSKIYPRAAGEMAVCLMRLKKYKDAEFVLRRAIFIYPHKDFLYMMLSYVLDSEGKYKKKVEVLLKGVKYAKNKSTFYFYVADTYFTHEHNIGEAIRYLKLSIKSDPKNADALNYLGYLYIDKGINVRKGVELVRKALKIQPNNPAFIDSLGWGYYKLGKYTLALKLLEKAVRLAGKNGDYVIDVHLAYAYYKNGNKKMALSIIRTVLRHHRDKQAEALFKRLK